MQQPLYLAVRNGYMNAYVEGQSVLRIAFDKSSKPTRLKGKVHHKYVRDDVEDQVYLEFDGHTYFYRGKPLVTDTEATTLAARVKRARGYTSAEKRGVAVIVGRHSNVIDVEMGLPANASVSPDARPNAPRMDIVTLEEDGAGAKLVFYEAKLSSNSELRAQNFQPRVLKQLQRYVDWMNSPDRADEVVSAYRRACQIQVQIHAMRGPGSASPLHPLVERAAHDSSSLSIDRNPRLVVFGYSTEAKGASWKPHEEALLSTGLKLIMAPTPEEIVLS